MQNVDERRLQFRVGVLVLATGVIAAVLVLLFADVPSLVRPSYRLTIELPHAGGLSEGSPVRRRGVLIGRVADVRLSERGGVEVVVDIDGDVAIARGEVPRVRVSLLGEAELDFVESPAEDRPPASQPASDTEARYSPRLPRRERTSAGRAC